MIEITLKFPIVDILELLLTNDTIQIIVLNIVSSFIFNYISSKKQIGA